MPDWSIPSNSNPDPYAGADAIYQGGKDISKLVMDYRDQAMRKAQSDAQIAQLAALTQHQTMVNDEFAKLAPNRAMLSQQDVERGGMSNRILGAQANVAEQTQGNQVEMSNLAVQDRRQGVERGALDNQFSRDTYGNRVTQSNQATEMGGINLGMAGEQLHDMIDDRPKRALERQIGVGLAQDRVNNLAQETKANRMGVEKNIAMAQTAIDQQSRAKQEQGLGLLNDPTGQALATSDPEMFKRSYGFDPRPIVAERNRIAAESARTEAEMKDKTRTYQDTFKSALEIGNLDAAKSSAKFLVFPMIRDSFDRAYKEQGPDAAAQLLNNSADEYMRAHGVDPNAQRGGAQAGSPTAPPSAPQSMQQQPQTPYAGANSLMGSQMPQAVGMLNQTQPQAQPQAQPPQQYTIKGRPVPPGTQYGRMGGKLGIKVNGQFMSFDGQ
jgi:hypothetical protein